MSFRWLTDQSALLYDPALKKLIHTTTRKVFAQLLNEFRRLGAVVIYGDLRRIGTYIGTYGVHFRLLT